ncbi:XF1762 family protein [Sporosarcina globispora]|uniref:XF1762 family protein n=1 Tax=Sporosarcina globispora TaxID=1459 RepID=UPI0006AA005C|nr:XF1762 family protein [Sporosarcina globispora]
MPFLTNWHWIFYKVKTNRYLITNEEEMRNGEMWDLLQDGYEIVWDSALSKKAAKEHLYEQIDSFIDWYKRDYPVEVSEPPRPVSLETVPITFRKACDFINEYHRHHKAPQGHRFSIGLTDGDKLVGVAIAGNPVARHINDGNTLEITRCCTKSGIYKNGITKLISAVYQAAKGLMWLKSLKLRYGK